MNIRSFGKYVKVVIIKEGRIKMEGRIFYDYHTLEYRSFIYRNGRIKKDACLISEDLKELEGLTGDFIKKELDTINANKNN